MSKQKKGKNLLDFSWLAAPYRALWAHSADEVPVWDSTRGFPHDLSVGGLTQSEYNQMLDYINHMDWYDPDDEALTATGCIRWMLRKPHWTPANAPKDGYPRLVRANYLDPIYQRECKPKNIINDFAQLVRHSPKPPRSSVLDEIATLNALVGPVSSPQDNTLTSWLELAQKVKAHLVVRRSLYLGDYESMCRDILLNYELHDQKSETQGDNSFAANPYAVFYTMLIWGAPVLVNRLRFDFSKPAEHNRNILAEAEPYFSIVGEEQFFVNLRELLGGPVKTVSLRDGRYVSEVSLADWVGFELLELWEPNAHILDCMGCEQPFFAKREGKSYCHNRCHVRKIDRENATRKRKGSDERFSH